MSSAESQTPETFGPEIVRFEMSISMPSLIDAITWLPDNKTLVVKSGGLVTVDLNTKSLTHRIDQKQLFFSWPKMVVSPDGAYLAILSDKLGVFSTSDWQPVSPQKWGREIGCSFSNTSGLRFTPDSNFMWVACTPGRDDDKTTIAVKLGVRDLSIAEKLKSSIDKYSSVTATISENSDDVIESAIVSGENQPPPNPTPFRMIASATNLATRSTVMAPFDLTGEIGESPAIAGQTLTPDHDTYIVEFGERNSGRIGFSSYEANTHSRIATFGSAEERSTPSRTHYLALSRLFVPEGTDLAIAALTTPNYDGGFRVWNYRTGELLQSLPAWGVLYLAVSPDQKRIAVQFRQEVRIYSVDVTKASKLESKGSDNDRR